ncbi:hypothetical protein [Bradyrhizobium sp. NAS80.1]|uniref:hypothetical protein n=1 Tax=Bradyrhizobium sp. NAS80.1 TaxID=1680159 RepID=UPI001161064C|nr:hypothetical protein [Bradyrhizobium sp. NAS80.1]
MLLRCAFFSALAVTTSLIKTSGAHAQAGPPSGGIQLQAQEKPAIPQPPPPAQVQIAPAASATPDKPPLPSAEQLVSLVRNVLLAVNDGNLTGNYTVLRDLSAPDSQGLNTPERLEESFRAIRQQGTDFSIVSVATPRFTQLPVFTPQGYLRLNGEFDSSPRITFDIFLQHVAGRWRPYAIGVGVVPVPLNPPPAAQVNSPQKSKGTTALANQHGAVGGPRKPKASKSEQGPSQGTE